MKGKWKWFWIPVGILIIIFVVTGDDNFQTAGGVWLRASFDLVIAFLNSTKNHFVTIGISPTFLEWYKVAA